MLVGSVTSFEEIEKIAPLVDLVELRLDHFDVLKKPPHPCIYTLRKKSQGGGRVIEEGDRLAKIEKYLEQNPEYVDLESDTDPKWIEKMAKRFPSVKWIGSLHDFEKTPEDLERLLEGMKNPHFSLYKIALQANSTSDMLRLMLFAQKAKAPLAVMSMGEYGEASRVIAPIVGSVLNYTGLQDDPHLHRYGVNTLLGIFHYRRLNPNTLIYALIGDPVEKSPGPLFHNAHFKRDAVYVKMRVESSDLLDVLTLMGQLPFGGLSVTRPLKECIYTQMDELSPIARAIGAINTVTFKGGRRIGTNTDAPGALNALEKHIQTQGKQLALLGAGGTARAIACEAKRRGADVFIFNRTLARAKTLAKELGCRGYSLEDLSQISYDILINTIPPVHSDWMPPLYPEKVVMDVIYTPKETPLLKEAKKRGCQCVYGEEMFIEQALLQQIEWDKT